MVMLGYTKCYNKIFFIHHGRVDCNLSNLEECKLQRIDLILEPVRNVDKSMPIVGYISTNFSIIGVRPEAIGLLSLAKVIVQWMQDLGVWLDAWQPVMRPDIGFFLSPPECSESSLITTTLQGAYI